MKKIFITGSCGFLMSNFIRKAIHFKLDYRVSSVDIISKNHILNNVFQNKNHSFNIGSCSDKHLMNVLFMVDKPDIIIHGAFADDSIEDNINQTVSLLERCKHHKINKFIFLSSDEVYGSSKDSLNENSELLPITDIGVTKSVCENFIKQYCKLYNIDYTIIRVSNFFGPRQNKKSFIVDSFNKLKNNKEVVLQNNGKNIKDWGHVVDAVNGLIKIIDNGKSNEVYNLSRNMFLSELEILTEFCDVLDFDKNLIKICKSSYDDYTCNMPNNDKLKSLGWEHEISLKESIEYFSKWYLDNNWWFND